MSLFIPHLAPVVVYLNNTRIQIKFLFDTNKRREQKMDSVTNQETTDDSESTVTNQETTEDSESTDKISLQDSEYSAKKRVAITNVMEATLESSFQLILQLYILATKYPQLSKIKDATFGSAFSPTAKGIETHLLWQVISIFISLFTLCWSFTSYHRHAKLGGLTLFGSAPLFFAILFQVVSRAIACTLFTLAYTWWVILVLVIHLSLVFILLLELEKRSERRLHYFFYIILSTIASTMVYFRLDYSNTTKKQLSPRRSTFIIQGLFLLLTLAENVVMVCVGIYGLDKTCYSHTFITAACILCFISYFIGVFLLCMYYRLYGHPWTGINGPSLAKSGDEKNLVLKLKHQDKEKVFEIPLLQCNSQTADNEQQNNN